MQRVKRSTAAVALPSPPAGGTPGYFTGGDPQTSTPATVPGYEWFNGVQEELAYVIEQAGLTMSGADNTQLRAAILSMIQSANSAVIITGATFEASVANGEAVRWDAGNSRFDEAIADGTANNRAAGIADVTNGKVYCYGETPALFAGLTPGSKYYLSSATAGAVTTTAPADIVVIGVAKSATVMFVDIDNIPSAAGEIENTLINGEFDIWQRGTSFTAAGYWADRWRGEIGAGATISQQAFSLGQTDVPGEPTFYLRHNRTGASGAANTIVEQRIESVRRHAGEGVRVRFYAKAGSAKTVDVDLLQHFGTGGTPSSDVTVSAQQINLTTAWQKFELTFAVPSISGKALGTNNNDYLSMRVREASGFGAFTIDLAEAVLSSSVTAASIKRTKPAEAVALCNRYYAKSYNIDVVPGTVTSVGQIGGTAGGSSQPDQPDLQGILTSRMRASPGVTWYSPVTGASGNVRNDNALTDLAVASTVGAGQATTGWPRTSGSTTVSDRLLAHWSADAEL